MAARAAARRDPEPEPVSPRGKKRILCVGLVCLDIITVVPAYPAEDTDTRYRGGGRWDSPAGALPRAGPAPTACGLAGACRSGGSGVGTPPTPARCWHCWEPPAPSWARWPPGMLESKWGAGGWGGTRGHPCLDVPTGPYASLLLAASSQPSCGLASWTHAMRCHSHPPAAIVTAGASRGAYAVPHAHGCAEPLTLLSVPQVSLRQISSAGAWM